MAYPAATQATAPVSIRVLPFPLRSTPPTRVHTKFETATRKGGGVPTYMPHSPVWIQCVKTRRARVVRGASGGAQTTGRARGGQWKRRGGEGGVESGQRVSRGHVQSGAFSHTRRTVSATTVVPDPLLCEPAPKIQVPAPCTYHGGMDIERPCECASVWEWAMRVVASITF